MVWKFLCAAFLDQWSLHLVVLHLVSSYAHAWVGERRGRAFSFHCQDSRSQNIEAACFLDDVLL